MSPFNDPAVVSDDDSGDSFDQLVDSDSSSLPDLVPYIQADQGLVYANAILVRDTDRHRWTDLVQTHVASWFYGDTSAFLCARGNAVYLGNNLTTYDLSRGPHGLVRHHFQSRLV